MNNDKKPICRLSSTDGNVYAIIGNVSRTLRKSGQRDKAKEWERRAMDSHSYQAVIALAFEYVDVK